MASQFLAWQQGQGGETAEQEQEEGGDGNKDASE